MVNSLLSMRETLEPIPALPKSGRSKGRREALQMLVLLGGWGVGGRSLDVGRRRQEEEAVPGSYCRTLPSPNRTGFGFSL